MDGTLVLELLDGEWSVARLAAAAAVPDWAWSGELSSVTRTASELSILAPSGQVPDDVTREDRFRALGVQGPLAFNVVGVLAELAGTLAEAEIAILAISTYDTDVLLVRGEDLERAVQALMARGHRIAG